MKSLTFMIAFIVMKCFVTMKFPHSIDDVDSSMLENFSDEPKIFAPDPELKALVDFSFIKYFKSVKSNFRYLILDMCVKNIKTCDYKLDASSFRQIPCFNSCMFLARIKIEKLDEIINSSYMVELIKYYVFCFGWRVLSNPNDADILQLKGCIADAKDNTLNSDNEIVSLSGHTQLDRWFMNFSTDNKLQHIQRLKCKSNFQYINNKNVANFYIFMQICDHFGANDLYTQEIPLELATWQRKYYKNMVRLLKNDKAKGIAPEDSKVKIIGNLKLPIFAELKRDLTLKHAMLKYISASLMKPYACADSRLIYYLEDCSKEIDNALKKMPYAELKEFKTVDINEEWEKQTLADVKKEQIRFIERLDLKIEKMNKEKPVSVQWNKLRLLRDESYRCNLRDLKKFCKDGQIKTTLQIQKYSTIMNNVCSAISAKLRNSKKNAKSILRRIFCVRAKSVGFPCNHKHSQSESIFSENKSTRDTEKAVQCHTCLINAKIMHAKKHVKGVSVRISFIDKLCKNLERLCNYVIHKTFTEELGHITSFEQASHAFEMLIVEYFNPDGMCLKKFRNSPKFDYQLGYIYKLLKCIVEQNKLVVYINRFFRHMKAVFSEFPNVIKPLHEQIQLNIKLIYEFPYVPYKGMYKYGSLNNHEYYMLRKRYNQLKDYVLGHFTLCEQLESYIKNVSTQFAICVDDAKILEEYFSIDCLVKEGRGDIIYINHIYEILNKLKPCLTEWKPIIFDYAYIYTCIALVCRRHSIKNNNDKESFKSAVKKITEVIEYNDDELDNFFMNYSSYKEKLAGHIISTIDVRTVRQACGYLDGILKFAGEENTDAETQDLLTYQ